MITQEKIVCCRCRRVEWWESRDKRQPYTGAIRAGWTRRGLQYTCPSCRPKKADDVPMEFKRTK